ncbi:methyltransferase domain-containing protein [Arthrobacter oryzae]|uniref:methyltransferase domain-containing protein n=1 Tax=Arthrobacter oryzae TaxID=409290 RepID=UPI00285B770B|nr:methyltransferase domain-containing protein [Arthrobacter oryzae]MDR6505350.1 hypothetical protein [Arthrobacter oryzae]
MINQQQLWDDEAAKHYDTPGEGMFSPEVLDPTVEVLSQLAGGGPAVEFAIGTGRVAIPLSEAGVQVSGIELSHAMISRLREKVGADRIPVVQGDMTEAVAGQNFSLGFLVFNTIANLLRRDAWIGRTPHRYIWPSELDLMARLAGFGLESRWADWDRSEFTAESRGHVSVYRLTS